MLNVQAEVGAQVRYENDSPPSREEASGIDSRHGPAVTHAVSVCAIETSLSLSVRLATQRWRLIGGGLAANHDRASRPPPPGPGPRTSKVSSHFRLSQSGQRTGNHAS